MSDNRKYYYLKLKENYFDSRYGWVYSPRIKRKVPAASARYGQDKAAGTNCKLKQRVRKAQKSFTGGV